MQRAFVIRPFGKKKDRAGREIDFENISEVLIEPALKNVELGGGTTGEIIQAGNIREDMFGLIPKADLIVCDITVLNANVFYELGIRHALRTKRTVLIRGAPSGDDVPFDILTDRYLEYKLDNPGESVEALTETLRATLASEATDSPVFKMLPNLPEADPDTLRVLPKDLADEVERARAGDAWGWLRLLSQEVETRDFQWPALRLIGRAQWDVGDEDGAVRTYQKLIAQDSLDLKANDALANLYERQYRRKKAPELLAASDQAIRTVLADNRATLDRRTESLSLKGRNAKTRWRLAFEALTNVADRRKAAANRQLIEAYEGYRNAYATDLNHFWSGLAALQMCAIAKSLAEEAAWENAFDSKAAAREKKKEVTLAFDTTKTAVKLAIDRARATLPADSGDRVWANISNADLLFLTDGNVERVKRAYRDTVPPTAWIADAVSGQLRLFSCLGVKSDIADAIIADLAGPPTIVPGPPPSIVIVTGHQIDEPGRAEVRFPERAEPAVKDRLRGELKKLAQQPDGVRVLASVASGTDIICHELCRELGVKSTLCLPMPPDSYSTETFKGELDGWRSRFLALVGAAGAECLQLNDAPGMPRWLQGTDTDVWERGNRWVLQLALTGRAPKVSLVAVWDGATMGDNKGGTAHMVQIVRAAGNVDVGIIKLKGGEVLPAGS
jgi:tetratricopeptide (TPR) repeat protein